MEKVNFQGEECYVGYKGLSDDLTNYQINYKYESGYWYRALDVDMSDVKCGYGLNITKNWKKALEFGDRVFKAYVPIKNNKIKFIEDGNKFRCQIFYLGEEIDLMEYWPELTESQKNLICMNNENFDIDKYWPELTEDQKRNLCKKAVLKSKERPTI